MIEINFQLKRDLDNTTETKSFTKNFDSDIISKEQLYESFEYFISEYIESEDNESNQVV